MENVQFRIHLRLNEFLQKLKPANFLEPRFLFFAAGWFISFFMLIQAYEAGFSLRFIFIAIHFWFWLFFNKEFWKKIVIPIELLIALVLFFTILDFIILNSADSSDVSQYITSARGWTLRGIAHKFFMSFALLFSGMLFSENNLKKHGVIIIYALFFVVGYVAFFYGQFSYLWIFQVFLFFSLLKRTSWLEQLTRLELLIYFALLLWLFLMITEPRFVEITRQVEEGFQNITYSLPYFLYMTLKLYWLAVLVRIPMVVIYNHASLSRKLRIAGLFQSTFPLLIQLAVLLLIFFLFISGWQAAQLRNQLMGSLSQSDNKIVLNPQPEADRVIITIPDYQPVLFDSSHPDQGIIQLYKNTSDSPADFYYYHINDQKDSIQVVQINESFLKQCSRNLILLAGSGLVAYPEIPKRWMKLLDELQFWQKSEVVKINPFGLIYPIASGTDIVDSSLHNTFEDQSEYTGTWTASFFGYQVSNPLLIVGRLELPLINAADPQYVVFLIDIYYDLRSFMQWNFMTQILLALLILFFLFNTFIIKRVVSFGSQINHSVVSKFDELKNGIREVSSGNLNYKVNIEGEDEFVELAQRFNQMGVRLQKTIDESREKDRLDQEMKMARQVQLSLLPESLPELEGYRIVAELETATEVGGDFYDVVRIDSQRAVFAIGDVSGKGSSAAFYMVQFISLFRYSLKFLSDPHEIASRLNAYIMDQVRDRQIFITAIIGLIDLNQGEVRLVRAGHNLPVLLSPSGKTVYKEINSKGLGIGLSKSESIFQKNLKSVSFKLEEGQKLVLYTDGIVEARRPVPESETDFDVYGEERLKDLLIDQKNADAHTLLRAMSSDLNDFYKDSPRIDDHTILIIERESRQQKI